MVKLSFVTIIYVNNSEIGGITGLFEKLVSLASTNPVQRKAGGAYYTMASTGALVSGIISIVGNFEVFLDKTFWQRAIATRPKSAICCFLIGAIPFTLLTTLGVEGLVADLQLSFQQVGSGLVAPFAPSHILGDIGAIRCSLLQ